MLGKNLYKELFVTRNGSNDEYIIDSINKEYKEIINKIQKEDIVLDLGAHIGSFAIYANVKKPLKIYCVEPDDENYKLLVKNTCKQKNIVLIKGAVTGQQRLINQKKGLFKVASISNKAVGCLRNCGTLEVNVFSLLELIEKYKPTIIKMDIETEERQIDFSKIDVRLIAIEYHPGTTGQRIHSQLTRNGYNLLNEPKLNSQNNTVGIYEKLTISLKG